MKFLFILLFMMPLVHAESKPVLVTGFGPFGAHSQNVSSLALEYIQGEADQVVTAVMPVHWEAVSAWAAALDPEKWGGVIALGIDESLSGGAITLEVTAHNRTVHIPDITGAYPPDHGYIIPGGPEAICSPAAAQAAHLFPVSTDPGGYLCGWLYYLLLYHLEELPVVLLHIPPEASPKAAAQSVHKILDLHFFK